MPLHACTKLLAVIVFGAGLLATEPLALAEEDASRPSDPLALRRTPVVEVFQKNKDAVVYVTGPLLRGDKPTTEEFFDLPGHREEETSLGSGFLIHPAGYVITNAHAVEQVIAYEVTLSEGSKVPAELIAVVRDQDLALLKIETARPLPAVGLAKAGDLLIGETVVVIANPHGLLHTCTRGIVSAVGRSTNPSGLPGVTLRDLIQTDAAINPGSSGGPWFNIAGQMIGVTTSRKPESENIGFAVPAAALRKVLPGMLDAERRYGLVTGLTVASEGPAKITAMEPDSPAAKAGLGLGDVLTGLDGRAVNDAADLALAMVGRKPGQKLPVKLLRDGNTVTATMVPGQRPKPDGAALLKQKFGLVAVPLDAQKAKDTLMRIPRGVTITEVDPQRYQGVEDPPEPGDVLARFNKIRPRDLDHVGLLVDRVQPGEPTTMVLLRKKGNVVTRIDLQTLAK